MADGAGPNAKDGAETGVAENLALQWENLRYVIKGKVILSDVSGRVDAGEMLASKYKVIRHGMFCFEHHYRRVRGVLTACLSPVLY